MDAPRTRLAVLGSPIAHSRSPLLHRSAYAVLGLDWSYERHELDEAGLDAFVAGFAASGRGLSLTMPLKQHAYDLAGTRDRVAEATRAVNTLWWDESGGLHGFNTDVGGLVTAVRESLPGAIDSVLVLGGGATAASAVLAAADLGACSVHVALRTPAKAAALEGLAASAGLSMTVGGLNELAGVDPDLVISTLPGGSSVSVAVPLALARRTPLFDVAYDPWPSALAQTWTDAGGRAVSGIGMLMHQAVLQVRIFVTGDPSRPLQREDEVLAAMRAALEDDAVRS